MIVMCQIYKRFEEDLDIFNDIQVAWISWLWEYAIFLNERNSNGFGCTTSFTIELVVMYTRVYILKL